MLLIEETCSLVFGKPFDLGEDGREISSVGAIELATDDELGQRCNGGAFEQDPQRHLNPELTPQP